MVKLKQVRSFLAVVDNGSVVKAAEAVCLSPSSVSAQLRELSEALGVSLLESSGRGVVLSSAGQLLLPKLRHLQRLSEEVTEQAKDLVSEPVGPLRLYAPSSLCIYRLPVAIEALQELAPGVELQLQHDPFDYHRALQERTLDAAILVLEEEAESGYSQQVFGREEIIFVGHPDLVDRSCLAPRELMGRVLISTEAECSYRIAAAEYFKQNGCRFEPRQCFSNVEVIRRCLLAKMGLGLLPRCVVQEDVDAGRLVIQQVTGFPLRFKSVVVWPKKTELSPRLRVFLQVVRKIRDSEAL